MAPTPAQSEHRSWAGGTSPNLQGTQVDPRCFPLYAKYQIRDGKQSSWSVNMPLNAVPPRWLGSTIAYRQVCIQQHTLPRCGFHISMITPFLFFTAPICFGGNIEPFKWWSLCLSNWKNLLKMFWLRRTEVQTWYPLWQQAIRKPAFCHTVMKSFCDLFDWFLDTTEEAEERRDHHLETYTPQ